VKAEAQMVDEGKVLAVVGHGVSLAEPWPNLGRTLAEPWPNQGRTNRRTDLVAERSDICTCSATSAVVGRPPRSSAAGIIREKMWVSLRRGPGGESDERLDAHWVDLSAVAKAHGDSVVVDFSLSHNCDVRKPVSSRLANPGTESRVSIVDVSPQSRAAAAGLNLKRVPDGAVDYRKDPYLARGQPDRQRAIVNLEQVGDHPFHGGNDAAVHHHRLKAPVSAVGDEIELSREMKVDLYRRQRLFSSSRVLHLEVDLRTIEGGFAPSLFVR
jgi:hypothetical protein